MRGVRALRAAGRVVDVFIVSAEHGVVPGNQLIAPYDVSFAGMTKSELRRRALAMGIPGAVADLLRRPDAHKFVLLGNEYLEACANDFKELGGPTVVWCSYRWADKIQQRPGLVVLPLDNRDAKIKGCGLMGLKGELTARVLEGMART